MAILDFLSAHLAILCLLSAINKFGFNWIKRRCPEYEFSTFFPNKCTGPIQMHKEANLILP